VNGDVGSRFRERDGNASTQAARRPGYKRCLALQIEFFKYQGNGSFPAGRGSSSFFIDDKGPG
jgi:hypothetical protein